MLTERRKRILNYMEEYFYKFGRCPTIREICIHFKFKSTNGVYEHLKALERDGYISLDKNKARGIKLLKSNRNIPILGFISAGEPIYPVIEEGEFLLDEQKTIKGNFLLKVKGNSMIDAGIYDGDLVSIDVDKKIENRDIVAIVVDGEVTLKRIKYEKDEIWLIPENRLYKPIPLKDKQFHIIGKAVMLIRKLS